MWPLQTAKRNIIIAGCLGMAYTQLTLSAASIEYVRQLGGNGLHIGILNALPVALLGFQFAAALIANHLTYRRTLWMTLAILQRAIVVPVACGPLLWPELGDRTWIWLFLLTIGLNQAILHFCTPLWLSWMGDYLPHGDLNSYWGRRERWLQWSAACSLFLGALLLFQSGLDIRVGYPVLCAIAGVLGIIDILMFLRIEEPPVTKLPQPSLWKVLVGPFLHRGFRSFIGFMCYWHFCAMIGATFISLYLLDYIGMSLFGVLSLWTWSWVGGALASRWFGALGDRFGNKPLLVLCVIFKSLNMIGLLSIPRDPSIAFAVLVPIFMFDAALNAGFAIATNGFLLKNSPAANRTMFIASGTAMAGMVGGVTAILAGAIQAALQDWSPVLWGYSWSTYHLFFLVSLLLRFYAVTLVIRIHEPTSHDAIQVVTYFVGTTPLRIIRYPIGLYRARFAASAAEERKSKRKAIREKLPVSPVASSTPTTAAMASTLRPVSLPVGKESPEPVAQA